MCLFYSKGDELKKVLSVIMAFPGIFIIGFTFAGWFDQFSFLLRLGLSLICSFIVVILLVVAILLDNE